MGFAWGLPSVPCPASQAPPCVANPKKIIMKIGVLGSGDVGKTLAAGFLKHGHHVTIGTREPAKLAAWQAQHSAARVSTFADTAQSSDVDLLAVKGTIAADALRAAGPTNLAGKTVIDATNPI